MTGQQAALDKWRRALEQRVAALERQDAQLAGQLARWATAGDPERAMEAYELALVHEAQALAQQRRQAIGAERQGVAEALRGERQRLAKAERWQARLAERARRAHRRRAERALAEWWAGREA